MASPFALARPSLSTTKGFFSPIRIRCVHQRGNTLEISVQPQPGAYEAISVARRLVRSWPNLQVTLHLVGAPRPLIYTGSSHPCAWEAHESLTAEDVIVLMRIYGRTITGLARQMNLPQTRIRAVRQSGLQSPSYVRDWLEAITSPNH